MQDKDNSTRIVLPKPRTIPRTILPAPKSPSLLLPVLPKYEIPTFEYLLSRWIEATARKNLWRTMPIHDFDDLVQEAALKYVICVDRYGSYLTPGHFGSLFRTAVVRRYHDLANNRTRKPSPFSISHLIDEEGEFEIVLAAPAIVDFEPDVKAFVESDPVLRLFVEAIRFGDDSTFTTRILSGRFETTVSRLCRLADLPRSSGENLLRKLEELLKMILPPDEVLV